MTDWLDISESVISLLVSPEGESQKTTETWCWVLMCVATYVLLILILFSMIYLCKKFRVCIHLTCTHYLFIFKKNK